MATPTLLGVVCIDCRQPGSILTDNGLLCAACWVRREKHLPPQKEPHET